ncbi:MAG: exopolysaccharide biosynthesis protein [Acidimicrobiales bacterium]
MRDEPQRPSSGLGRHAYRPGGRGPALDGSQSRLDRLRAGRRASRLTVRHRGGLRAVPLLRTRPRGKHRVSTHLEAWLTSEEPTTLGVLAETFAEKIFPVACLVLMAPSALPIPTAGATHLLDIIALVFAAQIAIGRRRLWLPAKWRTKELGARTSKAMGAIIRFIRKCEAISRPRGSSLITSRLGQAVFGVVMMVFILGALLSPPFSGLDTLPALGAALLALGLVLEDALFVAIGVAVGVGGFGLALTVGRKALQVVGL